MLIMVAITISKATCDKNYVIVPYLWFLELRGCLDVGFENDFVILNDQLHENALQKNTVRI